MHTFDAVCLSSVGDLETLLTCQTIQMQQIVNYTSIPNRLLMVFYLLIIKVAFTYVYNDISADFDLMDKLYDSLNRL